MLEDMLEELKRVELSSQDVSALFWLDRAVHTCLYTTTLEFYNQKIKKGDNHGKN